MFSLHDLATSSAARSRAGLFNLKPLAAVLCTVVLLLCGSALPAWAGATTVTTLVVKSGGNAVSTVPAASAVTLTASVTLGGTPVTTGQVAFCDATATYCLSVHKLGTAQLTSAGIASYTFTPGIGTYSYKAVFLPSASHPGSASSATGLTVTGTSNLSTATSFTSIDSLGNYLLTASVTGIGGVAAKPTGAVTFLDSSNNNAVLSTAPLGTSTLGLNFSNSSSPAIAAGSSSVVTADFNADGKMDFATANFATANVTIQLGKGDGTFTAASATPTTGLGPNAMVAADFNGDGKVDLATANASTTVSILLGAGDGTFTSAASLTPGAYPSGIVAGDFNEDGNQDLAVTNLTDSTVSIFLGNGDGTFGAATTVSAGTGPAGIVAADFNNDGHLDLAAAESGGTVQILLGDGTGAFTAGSAPASPTGSFSIAVGDFNGDGNVDIVVVSPTSLVVLVGDGTGNFSPDGSPASVGLNAEQVVVADFDQDGTDDIAVAEQTIPGAIAVFFGAGDGNFFGTSAIVDNNLTGLAVADFNGDGIPDGVATDYYYDTAPVVLTQISETATATVLSVTPIGLGNHNVVASYPGNTNTAPSVSSALGVAGVPATTTSLSVSSGGKQTASVATGSVVTLTATVGGLALQPAIRPNLNSDAVHPHDPPLPNANLGQVNFCDATATDCLGIHLLGTAQLNAAGVASMSYVPGIGTHNYKAVFLVDFFGAGSQSSAQPLTVTGSFTTQTAIFTTGSAGHYTLSATVIGESNIPVPVTGTVSFLDASNNNALLGTAALTGPQSALFFKAGLTQATGQTPQTVATADFNGDGYADAIVADYEDAVLTVFLGNGDGTFTAAPAVNVGGGVVGVVTGDWNNDGKPDVAVTIGNGLAILLGNGDGTFTAAASPTTGSTPEEIATADFNGDGNADLAVSNNTGASLTILLGNGDGTFTAAANPATGASPYGLTVGDFNGDHRPDLAVVNTLGPTVSILLGNGDGTFTAATPVSVGNNPFYIASGDFNSDGKVDLAVPNYNDSTVSILLGNGDGTFTAAASPATGSAPSGIALADINRDGKTDLMVSNYNDNSVSILLGNGDGTFYSADTTVTTGVAPYGVVAVDLNGDGVPDLLTPNYTDNTMSVLLTEPLEGAQATLTSVAPLGTGTHNVLASYPLTAPWGASQSATTPLAAAIGASTLALTANPAATSSFGDQVVLTAKLSPYAPEGVSTNGEIITFYSGTATIGTGALTNGVATLTLSTLPIGTSSLTAKYAGDGDLAASTTTALAFAVSNNSLTMTLQGGTTTTDIAADGTATYAFMVTPGSVSTFGEKVTFSVTGAPKNATATFNPTSMAAGSGAATVTLTIAMPATAAVKHRADIALMYWLKSAGFAPVAFALLLLPFAGKMRRTGKRMGGCAGLLLVLLMGAGAVAGLSGCGGTTTTVTPTPTPTATATNYTLTVTATSGANAKSTTLTLSVN